MRIVPRDGNAQTDVSTLESRYELVREIGRGATAFVYLARHRVTGEMVAIKAIRGEFAQDAAVAARFEREARTSAALRHPNIVRILAVARLEGRALAFVMQYVPGGTLRDALRDRPQASFEEAERVLRDMAAALAYAHAQGVVHRDVKPENIFIEEGSGRALLSDFGIARSLESDHQLTMTGSAIGTPTYMSPEQIDGLPVDGRSDLYSLGLVGWEMLAGQRPWEGDSLYSVIYKQKHQRLPRLDELRPGIPVPLLFAIEGALLKRREDRWAGAEEFLERLSNPERGTRPTPALSLDQGNPNAQTIEFRRPPSEPRGLDTVAAPDNEPGAGQSPDVVEGPTENDPREAAPASGDLTPQLLVGVPAAEVLEPTPPARRRWVRMSLLLVLGLPLLFALGILLARSREGRRGGRSDARTTRPGSAVATTSKGAIAEGQAIGAVARADSARPPIANAAPPVDSQRTNPAAGGTPGQVAPAESVEARQSTGSLPTDRTSSTIPATAPPSALPSTPPSTTRPASPPVTTIARRCASPAAADQDACLTARLAEHDVELNRVYNQLISRLRRRAQVRFGAPDPPDVRRLRVEQRAWIVQRDVECRNQGRESEGPLWATSRARCLGEIADYRTRELRARVRGL